MKRSRSIIATRALAPGEEILVVYESDLGHGSAEALSGGATGSKLAEALKEGQGVVPASKLLADYGFLADPTLGQAFFPGELERELGALTGGLGSTVEPGKNTAGLESAMLLTSALLEDYGDLKADAVAQIQQQNHYEAARTISSQDLTSNEKRSHDPKIMSPRMRLALLYRLGRTASILQAFGEQRRASAAPSKCSRR